MSTVAQDRSQGLHESCDRRFYTRTAPEASTKIVFGTDAGNLGTLLNLSENGLLVSTLLPIAVDSVHRVVLALHGIPKPLSLYLRTIWSDVSARKSGLQLLNLSEDDRMLLRAWALSQAKTVRTDTESSRAETADAPSRQANLRAPAPLTRALIPVQLESPVSAPIRYFWVAALATILLGATWAAVKTVGLVDSGKSILKGARSNSPNRKTAGEKSKSATAPAQPDATMPSDGKTTSASAVTEPQQEHVAVTNQSIAAMPLAGPSADVHSSSNGGVTEPKHRVTTSQRISRPQSEEVLRGNDTLDSVPTDSETQTAPAGNRRTQLEEKETASSQLAARESTASASVNSEPAGAVSPQVPTHATTTGSTGVVSGSTDSLPRVLSRDSAASSRTPSGNPTSAISSISKAPPADPTALDPKPDPKLENPDSRPMDKRAATSNPNGSGGGSSETLARPSMIDRSAPPPALTTQTLEVPAFSGAAYVRLPGESVVRSPSVTMHIQRSVWVKASHWLWHSHKKVQLGELAARVDPQMPRSAKSYGSITVLATIEKDGQVSSVRPLYGSPQFLGSVMRAVREWRYQPTYVEEKPVETLARIEINFHAPLSTYSR
jgi:outer membrane biosynthesis protein TonB